MLSALIRDAKDSRFFVTGIGTEVGKTVASAILTQALQAEYWKPIQCGDLDNSDSHKIQRWVSHPHLQIHPNTHALQMPASPHAAAEAEGVQLQLSDFQIPATTRPLIVEGAGGLLVPLSDQACIIDLIAALELEIILVSRNYLGSINHTLLSLEVLTKRQLPIAGILFNGPSTPSTESIIQKYYPHIPVLGRVEELEEVDSESVKREAARLLAAN